MRKQNKKYVVDAMQSRANKKSAELHNVTNAASRFRTNVSEQEIDGAIVKHCQSSVEQLAALKKRKQ